MRSHEAPMATVLTRIAERARREPTATFDNVWHVMGEEFLADCFHSLRRDAAAGVDSVTYAAYAAELPTRLSELVARLKIFAYRPQPVKRVYIPKSGGGQRPLGIPALEDKIVQEGMRRILTAVFEGDFLDCSYGFRPQRGGHLALRELEAVLARQPVNYVIDADIHAFFDSVPHDALLTCVQQRLTDRRFLRYLVRFLKAGVMAEGIRLPETAAGVPQGGLISPILANIYLHYLLDVWFAQQGQAGLRGYAALNRYADDFVVCLQHEDDATLMLARLRERLARGGLTLAEHKTRVLLFSRYAAERAAHSRYPPGTFDYLGFTHYWTPVGPGLPKGRLGRKSSRHRVRQKLQQLTAWLKRERHAPLPALWRAVVQKLRGHCAYYGIPGNWWAVRQYCEEVKKAVFRWLNRRSQRRSWTWVAFDAYVERFPLPRGTCRVRWADS
jgi:group II intron reverse transcriptase/maturase